jgi:hypothetical protein
MPSNRRPLWFDRRDPARLSRSCRLLPEGVFDCLLKAFRCIGLKLDILKPPRRFFRFHGVSIALWHVRWISGIHPTQPPAVSSLHAGLGRRSRATRAATPQPWRAGLSPRFVAKGTHDGLDLHLACPGCRMRLPAQDGASSSSRTRLAPTIPASWLLAPASHTGAPLAAGWIFYGFAHVRN